MVPTRRKKTVLVVSHDPKLADVRKRVLEAAGFRVVAARTLVKVIDACDSRHIDMAMIGYSLPPAEKRRVWTEIHQRCKVPILELYRGDKAELMEESVHTHQSSTPEDFLHTIQRLLRDAD